jgi:hypothetical protein
MKTHSRIFPLTTDKTTLIRYYKYIDTLGYYDKFSLTETLIYSRVTRSGTEFKMFDTNSSDIMLVTYINSFERL